MLPSDYKKVYDIWELCELKIEPEDTKEAITRFLDNQTSAGFVACISHNIIVGSILCGSDGRYGYLHHLAVHPDVRSKGVGAGLVERALLFLYQHNIETAAVFANEECQNAMEFWENVGWKYQQNLHVFSHKVV